MNSLVGYKLRYKQARQAIAKIKDEGEEGRGKQAEFTYVQISLAEACVTFSNTCILFGKFYCCIGFGDGKQKFHSGSQGIFYGTCLHAQFGEGLQCREGSQGMDSAETLHQMEEGHL